MRKLIDGLAIASFVLSLTTVGAIGFGYLALTNKTNQEKIKTEERLTAQLASEGVKPATPTKKEIFPVDTRVNINTASARQLADALPGVGLKTAREIKDLQSSMLGEKFIKLDQLKSIKRIDWDELIKDNLIRVE